MAVVVDSHNVWLVTAAFGDLMVLRVWKLTHELGRMNEPSDVKSFS
jgi:hypothetical protein